MKTIVARIPQEFFFECKTCGKYRVGEATLRRFITPALNKKLNRSLLRGSAGAILKFKEGCPACQPNVPSEAELVALGRKVH